MFDFIRKITRTYKADAVKAIEVKSEAPKPVLQSLNYDASKKIHDTVEKALKRGYEAAAANRKLASWNGSYATPDEEIKNATITLRARARDLELNNDYAQQYLNLQVVNVVGAGFNFQPKIKEDTGVLDTLANNLFRENFTEWCKRGNCEIAGRLSFYDLQRLIIKTVGRDGECLVRKIRDPKVNKWGYSLQFLEIDRLAVHFNGHVPSNGNKVIMGCELDKYGRPVAYFISKELTAHQVVSEKDLERVPANDIFHIYRPHRAEQTRGVTWMHSAMITLEMIGAYMELMIIQQQIATTQSLVIVAPEGDPSAIGDFNEMRGEYERQLEGGQTTVLPPGWNIQQFTPEAPSSFDPFIKTQLRAAAAGLKVSYYSLANDLEGVNFSSIRQGVLQERDTYIATQDWFISWFLEPLYNEWVTESLKNGAISYPGGAVLPFAKLEKFKAVAIKGRRWSWVDPEKEINATILAINSVLGSRQEALANMGMEYEQVLADQVYEQEQIKAAGIYVSGLTDAQTTKDTVTATKSITQDLNDVKRSIEDLKSVPAAAQVVPSITVEAPQIHLSPVMKNPGTVTNREIVRNAQGLIVGFKEVENFDQAPIKQEEVQQEEQTKEGT